jgi:hypothetical protein
VRRRKFIHIGSITSIDIIFCLAKLSLDIANAKGYAKTRQSTVAIAASEILLTSAGIYFTACSAFEIVNAPEASVKAK